MKRIVHPSNPPGSEPKAPRPIDPPLKDISIDGLLGDGLLALHREVKNLLILGVRGKLEPSDSKDLRDIVKLLFELKDREADLLKALDDDELKTMVQE